MLDLVHRDISHQFSTVLRSFLYNRLETLNEKRSGVVQMVKLAEKERDGLEVLTVLCFIFSLFHLA